MKIKCPEFFRLEFPSVPWFVEIHEFKEDWEDSYSVGTAGSLPEGEEVEILEESLPFIKIRGKNIAGNVIEGWVRKHVIYNEEE